MKTDRIHWGMILFSVVAVCAFAFSVAHAETIRYYDRQYTALKAAMHHCRDSGGSWDDLDWSQAQRYRLDKVEGGYMVFGSGLFVVCKIPKLSAWLVSWDAPTRNADDTPLASSDIAGYLLSVNGGDPAMVSGTTFLLTELSSGDTLSLITVTTDGRTSSPAEATYQ